MAGSTRAFPSAEAPPRAPARARHYSPWLEAWRRFRHHRLAVASAAILVVIVLAIAFGTLIWRGPINEIDFTSRLQGPARAHSVVTDHLRLDLLARQLYCGATLLPQPARGNCGRDLCLYRLQPAADHS